MKRKELNLEGGRHEHFQDFEVKEIERFTEWNRSYEHQPRANEEMKVP